MITYYSLIFNPSFINILCPIIQRTQRSNNEYIYTSFDASGQTRNCHLCIHSCGGQTRVIRVQDKCHANLKETLEEGNNTMRQGCSGIRAKIQIPDSRLNYYIATNCEGCSKQMSMPYSLTSRSAWKRKTRIFGTVFSGLISKKNNTQPIRDPVVSAVTRCI